MKELGMPHENTDIAWAHWLDETLLPYLNSVEPKRKIELWKALTSAHTAATAGRFWLYGTEEQQSDYSELGGTPCAPTLFDPVAELLLDDMKRGIGKVASELRGNVGLPSDLVLWADLRCDMIDPGHVLDCVRAGMKVERSRSTTSENRMTLQSPRDIEERGA
jgi:hypothetical protein